MLCGDGCLPRSAQRVRGESCPSVDLPQVSSGNRPHNLAHLLARVFGAGETRDAMAPIAGTIPVGLSLSPGPVCDRYPTVDVRHGTTFATITTTLDPR